MTVTGSYTTTGFTFEGMSAEEIRDICLAAGLAGIDAGPPLLANLTVAEIEAPPFAAGPKYNIEAWKARVDDTNPLAESALNFRRSGTQGE